MKKSILSVFILVTLVASVFAASYTNNPYQKLADEEGDHLVGLFSRENEVKIINIDSIMYKYFSLYIRRTNLSLQPSNKVLERKI